MAQLLRDMIAQIPCVFILSIPVVFVWLNWHFYAKGKEIREKNRERERREEEDRQRERDQRAARRYVMSRVPEELFMSAPGSERERELLQLLLDNLDLFHTPTLREFSEKARTEGRQSIREALETAVEERISASVQFARKHLGKRGSQ